MLALPIHIGQALSCYNNMQKMNRKHLSSTDMYVRLYSEYPCHQMLRQTEIIDVSIPRNKQSGYTFPHQSGEITGFDIEPTFEQIVRIIPS